MSGDWILALAYLIIIVYLLLSVYSLVAWLISGIVYLYRRCEGDIDIIIILIWVTYIVEYTLVGVLLVTLIFQGILAWA